MKYEAQLMLTARETLLNALEHIDMLHQTDGEEFLKHIADAFAHCAYAACRLETLHQVTALSLLADALLRKK